MVTVQATSLRNGRALPLMARWPTKRLTWYRVGSWYLFCAPFCFPLLSLCSEMQNTTTNQFPPAAPPKQWLATLRRNSRRYHCRVRRVNGTCKLAKGPAGENGVGHRSITRRARHRSSTQGAKPLHARRFWQHGIAKGPDQQRR